MTLDLGKLAKGDHTVTLGGYNNKKTMADEWTKLKFDNVTLKTGTLSTPTPTPPPGNDVSGLEPFEAEVVRLTNEYRAKYGKAPLQVDSRLNTAADKWSESMAKGDFFKHSTPQLVSDQGYKWRAWGENIAAGQKTPEQVVNAWINSPGHRANILQDAFKEIGVGHYYMANDTGSLKWNHYWTQTFATESGASYA